MLPRPRLTSTTGALLDRTSSDCSRARPRTPLCVTSLRISRTGIRRMRSNKVGSARTAWPCPLSFAQPRNGGFCGFLVGWSLGSTTSESTSAPGLRHPGHHRPAIAPALPSTSRTACYATLTRTAEETCEDCSAPRPARGMNLPDSPAPNARARSTDWSHRAPPARSPSRDCP